MLEALRNAGLHAARLHRLAGGVFLIPFPG